MDKIESAKNFSKEFYLGNEKSITNKAMDLIKSFNLDETCVLSAILYYPYCKVGVSKKEDVLSSKEIEELNKIRQEFKEKLNLTDKQLAKVIDEIKEDFGEDGGIRLIEYKDKIQLCTNQKYVEEVSSILNPIRERALTKATLETVAIIAYKIEIKNDFLYFAIPLIFSSVKTPASFVRAK